MITVTDSKIELVARALRRKRAELIARPLERIYPDLARTALEVILEDSTKGSVMFELNAQVLPETPTILSPP